MTKEQKEAMKNVRPVCSDCMDDIRKDFQKSNKINQLITGHNAKITLKNNEGRKEHIWVLVKSINNNEIIGNINNVPVIVTDWKVGDEITFKRSDISDIFELQ